MATRSTKTTTSHEEIQRWAEERGGKPACVKGTGRGKDDTGMIRLDFPGFSGRRSLQEISWGDWFKAFDENNLALIYQDRTAQGQRSNFNKLVGRDTVEQRKRGNAHASRHRKPVATSAGRASTTARRRGTQRSSARSRKSA